MNETKTLIFILGMHRSGTSALTRMINLLGARLGDEMIEPQTGVNDRGFWENREMVAVNEAILDALDSAWYDYGEYPRQWWHKPRFKEFRQQIVEWLRRRFGDAEMVVLKDPRLCRLLPIWHDAAKEAGFQSKAILAIRAPHEVRQSLLSRDPFTPVTCDLLWLRYLEDAERFSRDMPRVTVDYHQLLHDWRKVADEIALKLALHWPVNADKASRSIAPEIDPALRRQHIEDETMRSPISRELDTIHLQIQARLPDLPVESSHTPISEPLARYADCAPLLFDTNHRLVSKASELQQTGEALAHAHGVMEEKDAGIADLDQRLHALGKAHAETLQTINARDEQLAERNREFEQLQRWAEQLEQDLRKSGEWAKEMESEAQKNWRSYEEATTTLNRIHDHPVVGRLCRALKLHQPS